MRRRRLIGSALAAIALAAAIVVVPVGPRPAAAACAEFGEIFEPADGKTLMIIGQDRDSIDNYVAGTGIPPGGVMVYTSIAAPTLGLLAPLNIGSGYHDMQYELTRYPNTTIQIGLHMVSQLDAINAGVHDTNIVTMARLLKDTNRPVFLRIGYEFDGAHNAYDPAKYVLAFRRIVNKMRAEGVTNVAYTWHSVAAPRYQGRPLAAWYPGDGYVDWTGVSVFGQAFNNGAGLAFAHEMADFADAHNKPLMIGESTPRGAKTPTANGDQLWNNWYVPTINFVNSRGVKAWSYINANWDAQPMWEGQGWGDSRVEANPVLRSHWLNEITQARYLNASPSLFCNELGYP